MAPGRLDQLALKQIKTAQRLPYTKEQRVAEVQPVGNEFRATEHS